MLRDLQYALLTPKKENQLLKNPASLKVLLAIIGFAFSLMLDIKQLIVEILLLLLISFINGISLNILRGLKASFKPLIILAIFSYVFYGFNYTLRLIIRLITIIILINLFYLSVRPLEIAIFLERLGFPKTLTISIELSFKAIPVIIKDAEEALIALFLKGRFKGRRWISQYLATILISSNIRSYALAEYMASRFYGAKRRKKSPYESELNLTSFLILLGIIWPILSFLLISNGFFNFFKSFFLFL